MYHNRAYRKLGRTHTHRLATLRALSTALFERERIRTTLMKAKELRPFAEKLITRSKRDDLHARRLVARHINDKDVAKKLFDTLSPRFQERNGGYMRILKLGPRQGDGAEMAIVELIGSEPVFKKHEEVKKKGLAARLRGGRSARKAATEEAPEEADAGAPEVEAAAEEAPTRSKKKAAGGKKRSATAKPKGKSPRGGKKK